MKFLVVLKSGVKGEPEVSVEIEARHEAEAIEWGRMQIEHWGWEQGEVVRVEAKPAVTENT